MIVTRPMFRQFKPVAPEKIFRVLRWKTVHYLSMKTLLIQGAIPYDADVHAREGNFQGGYRCTLNIISQAALGSVAIGWDTLGFEYTPKSRSWYGHDTFSYSITNSLGQESDATCLHIFVGL